MELGSVVLQCSHYCIPSHKLISSSLPRITDYSTNEFPLRRIAARRIRVDSCLVVLYSRFLMFWDM